MTEQPDSAPYRVLARKYRPGRFDELIGQEALVRTLTNAIETGRLAHAFLLTGVRGVGKTSTARIIARALNCIGPDGAGGPTPNPCGVCENCTAIAEDRHVDVLEMDAASRTGVDDIRELIDGARYRPVQARFKIYIIDEVHMLSRNAFNALLKTLEEPAAHVKFVFATTEIRKVPVTVLSRCQRFDLRRVEEDALSAHFSMIAESEGIEIAADALGLIVRAAGGSVRDGLSLLDQAVAHAGGAAIAGDAVRAMLGLADQGLMFDLFEAVMRGDAAGALGQFGALYDSGADPEQVLRDLAELTHFLSKRKIVPDAPGGPAASETEQTRSAALAAALSVPVLSRAWQILLKGLAETATAPEARAAAEMVLVRLAYAASLPTPAEIIESLNNQDGPGGPGDAASGGEARPSQSPPLAQSPSSAHAAPPLQAGGADSSGSTAPVGPAPEARLSAGEVEGILAFHPRSETDPESLPGLVPDQAEPGQAEPGVAGPDPMPDSFESALALFERYREARLHAHLVNDVHLVRFEPGRIEFRPTDTAPANLAAEMAARLGEWTGQRWMVSLSNAPGAPTLREERDSQNAARRAAALDDPLVKAALATFPGATVEDIRAAPALPDAAPDPDDEEL